MTGKAIPDQAQSSPPEIREVARRALAQLELRTREGGKIFCCQKEGAPAWLTSLVFAVHEDGDLLPDDWRYFMLREILELIATCDSGEFEELYPEPPVSSADLLSYIASHSLRSRHYFEQGVSDLLGDQDLPGYLRREGLDGLISLAYITEWGEVKAAVLGFLAESASSILERGTTRVTV